VLDEGEPADSPRAIAQAGPYTAIVFHVVGPIQYTGHAMIGRDIENLKSAIADVDRAPRLPAQLLAERTRQRPETIQS